MSMSDLTDHDILALDNVLMALREAYDRAINGTAVVKEMTGEDMQGAYEGLALFGKRMMEFEEKLRDLHERKKVVDLVVRASQVKAKQMEAVDKYLNVKSKEESDG